MTTEVERDDLNADSPWNFGLKKTSRISNLRRATRSPVSAELSLKLREELSSRFPTPETGRLSYSQEASFGTGSPFT
jgi:hypothetical protein